MASFEEIEVVDPWKVYRPTESAKADARAWWRYAIFAELYRVRCFQRAEKWREAGNKNMNILSHIRVLIASHGSVADVDLSSVSDSYLNDTAEELKYLQTVVGDLSRENMTLRRMIKSLLTPMNKERLISDDTTLRYIENQVSLLDNHSRTQQNSSTTRSSPEKSEASMTLKLGGTMETEEEESNEAGDHEDELDELANSIESPDINLRSPYENVLPPIALNEHSVQASGSPNGTKKGGKERKSPRTKQVKYVQEKFPSYLEREAMRKEAAKKKKEKIILRKAERLLQIAAEKEEQQRSQQSPAQVEPKKERSGSPVTMFLPILPIKQTRAQAGGDSNISRSSKTSNICNKNRVSPARSSPTPCVTSGRGAEGIIVGQPASAAELAHGSSALDSASIISSKSGKSNNKKKVMVQPEWIDDFKIEDKLYGRGRGKPKEDVVVPAGEARTGMSSKNRGKSGKEATKNAKIPAQQSAVTGKSSEDSAPATVTQDDYTTSPQQPRAPTGEKEHTSPRGRLMYPKPSADMTEGEKLTVELISKARGKVLSPDEANKPLSKIEMTLLKSPLALPLVKPMPGDSALSPRAAALRTSPSNKSTGFRSPRSPRKSAKTLVARSEEATRTPLTLTDESDASAAALVSQSAPGSVMGTKHATKQAQLTPNSGTSSSPVNGSASETSMKKKSVLKALNGKKTTPINSPRKDGTSPGFVTPLPHCETQQQQSNHPNNTSKEGGHEGGVYRRLSETLASETIESALHKLQLT